MVHSTSGRSVYGDKWIPNAPLITDEEVSKNGAKRLEEVGVSYEKLCSMLKRENELRLSQEVQSEYRELGEEGLASWLNLTADVQRRVAVEFGFVEPSLVSERNSQFGVNLLQCASSLVRDDPERVNEVRELSLYRKYNRCKDGSLVEGQLVSKILTERPLYYHDPSLTPVFFSALLDSTKGRPAIFLAGSVS